MRKMAKKKTPYEKQAGKLHREISALKAVIADKMEQLKAKEEELRQLNLSHNAQAIQSMQQMMLDASDSVDLQSLMQKAGFRSAFEAFLRREAEKKDAPATVSVKKPAASAAETSPVSAENGPDKGSEVTEKIPEKGTAPKDSGLKDSDKESKEENKPDEKNENPAEKPSEKGTDKPETPEHPEESADEKKDEAVFTPIESAAASAPKENEPSDHKEENPSEPSDDGEAGFHWEPPKEVWDGR